MRVPLALHTLMTQSNKLNSRLAYLGSCCFLSMQKRWSLERTRLNQEVLSSQHSKTSCIRKQTMPRKTSTHKMIFIFLNTVNEYAFLFKSIQHQASYETDRLVTVHWKGLHLAQITSSTTLHFIPMTLGQGSFFQYGFHIISLWGWTKSKNKWGSQFYLEGWTIVLIQQYFSQVFN